jgi:hypothetical protein
VSKRTIILHAAEDAQRAHTLASVFDPLTVVVAEIRPSMSDLHLSGSMERVVLWSTAAAPHLEVITRLADAKRLSLCLVDDTPVPVPLSAGRQIRTGSMDGGVDATFILNALGPREHRIKGTGVSPHVEAARTPAKSGLDIFAAFGVVLAAVAGAAIWISQQSESAPVQSRVVVAPSSADAEPSPDTRAPEPAAEQDVSAPPAEPAAPPSDGSLALRDRLPAPEVSEAPNVDAPPPTPEGPAPPLEQAPEGKP